MPNSILVSSLRCLNKNQKQQKNKDLGKNLWYHTNYIATRPGVALPEDDVSWLSGLIQEAEAFMEEEIMADAESLDGSPPEGPVTVGTLAGSVSRDGPPPEGPVTVGTGAVSESLAGSPPDYAESEDMIQDAAPGSSRPASPLQGLFGNFDVSDLSAAASHIRSLADGGRTIFQGFLSLREDDAIAMGYDKRQKWEDYMNRMMPEAADFLNIPYASHRWCAAVHMIKGHPHVHYLIWNEKDEVREPFVSTQEQHAYREMMSKEIFREEYQEKLYEKQAMEDTLSCFSQRLTSEAVEYIFRPCPDYLPKFFPKDDMADMGTLLLELASRLKEGRSHDTFKYGYLPPRLKEEVDRLTYYVLKHPSIRDAYTKYLDSINGKTLAASATGRSRIVSLKKAVRGIRSKVGNNILKACKNILERNPGAADQVEADAGKLLPRPVLPETVLPDSTQSEIDKLLKPLAGLAANTKYPDDFQFFLGTEWEHYFEIASSIPRHYTMKSDDRYRSALKTVYGDFPDEEKNAAMAELESMADNDNLLALDALGRIYDSGVLAASDPQKAAGFYRRALEGYLCCLKGPGLSYQSGCRNMLKV